MVCIDLILTVNTSLLVLFKLPAQCCLFAKIPHDRGVSSFSILISLFCSIFSLQGSSKKELSRYEKHLQKSKDSKSRKHHTHAIPVSIEGRKMAL